MSKLLPFIFFFMVIQSYTQAQVGIETPSNFTVTDTHGETHTLFDYLDDGKYVLIDFFFTTCNSCISAMPALNQASERYGCNQGDIVFIGLDRGNSNAEVIAFENTYGGYYPAVSGTEGGADNVVTAYGVAYFPTIALIAPNHTFVAKDIYPVTKTNLDKAIHLDAGLPYNPDACLATDNHNPLAGKVALKLFPNPVINNASVEISIARSMQITVNIINLLGQTIHTPIDTVLSSPTTRYIEFSDFNPGMYFIQLIADGDVVSTQRFSKIAP
ncbi:MAG TPA: T9SS type A sorting domain-containing protein [Saprospiraceae bacterium]|nr:T9SS type A sorting domain-containing protein [Saprospiraceae bacterium]